MDHPKPDFLFFGFFLDLFEEQRDVYPLFLTLRLRLTSEADVWVVTLCDKSTMVNDVTICHNWSVTMRYGALQSVTGKINYKNG